MRSFDSFLDRALEERPGEVDVLPVAGGEPEPVQPVPRVERPSLEARRKQLEALLEGVLLRGGVYELDDFRGNFWERHHADTYEQLERLQDEAAGLLLDDVLAGDWAEVFGVSVPQFRRWRDAVLTPEGKFWLDEQAQGTRRYAACLPACRTLIAWATVGTPDNDNATDGRPGAVAG